MPKDKDKISSGDSPRRSHLPLLVVVGLIILSGIIFLVFQPGKKPLPSSPSSPLPATPTARPATERPLPFSPPAESQSPRAQSPQVVINPDHTESYVEPDPALRTLELALQSGRCEEFMNLAGPSAQEEGPRRFYASFIYSSGVRYWELKDYQKAANYMRCLMSNYQDYRDEALLVLTESEIALGDKTQARKHLQELKTNFPNRKEEIIKLEQKLTLGK
ncbi:MAG: hypothetical protein NT009_13170 [Proteobacteria bacterium]|nr:hypothetical protein [Pseudomonadota bacterium]